MHLGRIGTVSHSTDAGGSVYDPDVLCGVSGGVDLGKYKTMVFSLRGVSVLSHVHRESGPPFVSPESFAEKIDSNIVRDICVQAGVNGRV